MKQKGLVFALAAGCIILVIICYMLGTKHDGEAPVIQVEDKDITYTEGEDESILLEGVTATDNKDGDITEQIFIDKILPIDEGHAIVYYGVLDASNNVGSARRTIQYYRNEDGSQDMTEESASTEEIMEDTTGEISTEATQDGYGVPRAEGSPDIQPDGGRPAMALVTESVKIRVEDTFDPISLVWGVVDDKDGADILYQHIHAEGEYSTQTPGTYEIRYYVSDSDGNTSDPQIVTLTVE